MANNDAADDFDAPTGWRDPAALIRRQRVGHRYMGDVVRAERAPQGSIRDVFREQEDVILTFLFRTEREKARGNIGKAVFRRKPPDNVRIVPVSHEELKVTFDPVDGAKDYAVQIKASGECNELFEISWQLKTKKRIRWEMVERNTRQPMAKDPCIKINAVPVGVKRHAWFEDDKEAARRLWHEAWDAWQGHWDDARGGECVKPPCTFVDVKGDSTYIARVQVSE